MAYFSSSVSDEPPRPKPMNKTQRRTIAQALDFFDNHPGAPYSPFFYYRQNELAALAHQDQIFRMNQEADRAARGGNGHQEGQQPNSHGDNGPSNSGWREQRRVGPTPAQRETLRRMGPQKDVPFIEGVIPYPDLYRATHGRFMNPGGPGDWQDYYDSYLPGNTPVISKNPHFLPPGAPGTEGFVDEGWEEDEEVEAA